MSERLAAHAAGDLSPDEAAAMEAALAGDPALRARFDRIRRLDDLLGNLDDVEVPAAFSARLRDEVRAELASNAAVVDLASRRRAPRFMAAAAGLAAALAAVVGVANLGSLGGTDDSSTTADTAAQAPFDEAARDADVSEEMGTAMVQPAGPTYATGGAYDRDNLADLGDQEQILTALGAAALDPAGTQARFAEQLVLAAEGPAGTSAVTQDDAAGGESAPEPAPGVAADGASTNAVSTCLPIILDGDRVPLFADLGTFEEEPALILVLGAPDAGGDFARLEFYVMSPTSCDLLHFAQID